MKIKYLNGEKIGAVEEILPPGVSLGRETDNDIQLLVAGISRYHAKLSYDGMVWKISDAGSTNGTFVNGKRIDDAIEIHSGDVFELGTQKFLFGEIFESAGKTAAAEPAEKEEIETAEKKADETASRVRIAPEMETLHKKNDLPEEEKKAVDPETFLKTLHGAKSIFGKKNDPAAAENQDPSGKKHLFSGRLGNILFALLVIMIAVVVMFFFTVFMNGSNNRSQQTVAAKPVIPNFLLYYEKVLISKDNVFRFVMKIEDDTAEFILDDLLHQRHSVKEVKKIKEAALKTLKSNISDSNFMTLESISDFAAQSDSGEKRTLLISLDGKFKKMTAYSNVQTTFEQVEKDVYRFAEAHGFRGEYLSVAEVKKEALNQFYVAEQQYANWRAKPGNLREALYRYKLAMEYLETFDPRPQEWEISRKKCEEVQKLRTSLMKQVISNIQQYQTLRQYKKASMECQRGMDMLAPESKMYQDLKQRKLDFDRKLR